MELSIHGRKVFGPIAEERQAKMASLCAPAAEMERSFRRLLKDLNRMEEGILRALEYAKGLDFSKSALKSSYLSHPIRVADFLLRIDPAVPRDAVVTALLHNVPETTSVSLAEIETNFGATVSSGIGALLVDRKVSFSVIREAYYEKLKKSGDKILLIKLLDKMDNLFTLCLNADDAVRRDYLAEIREKLLPFARAYDAQLGQYLENLLNDAGHTGFSKELKNELDQYQLQQTRASS